MKLFPERALTGDPSPRAATSRLALSLKKARETVSAYLGFGKGGVPAISPWIPEAVLTVDSPIIANHLIGGRWIIPASHMLAHVHATLAREPGARRDELRDVVFKHPPEVKGHYLVETRRAAGTGFVFLAGGEPMAEGRAEPCPSAGPDLEHSLSASPMFPLTDFYDRIKLLGYGYGPGLRVVDAYSDDGARAIYRLSQKLGALPTGTVNPFILDGIFQCILHASDVEAPMRREQTMFLPFRIESLRLYRQMPERCICVIEHRDLENRDRELAASVRVFTTDGHPVLDVDRMTLARLAVELTSLSDARFTAGGIHAFAQAWVRATPPEEGHPDGVWILAGDGSAADAAGHRIGAELSRQGVEVVHAQPGSPDRHGADQVIRLPFADAEAWQSLITTLPEHEPLTIVYLPSFVTDGDRSLKAEAALAGALALLRALIRSHRKCRVRFPTWRALAITDTDRVEGYALGGVAGLLATVRLESGIDAAMIDLDEADELPRVLLAEHTATDEAAIAYRKGVRHLSSYEPAALSDAAPIKEGVYVMAGGAGGIGRKLCLYLAPRHAGLHFAWIGRSPMDGDKEEAAKAVRALGGEVTYFQADVADETQVRAALARIRELGTVRGVIHTAGSNDEALIQNKEWASFEEVYRAKVRGVEILDRLTADLPLDFFVAFASTIGVTGSVGQADYAAANACLDSFAHHRQARSLSRKNRSVAIDWTLWNDGGMGLNDGVRTKFLKRTGVIRSALAFPLLERILASDRVQVIVAGNDHFFQARHRTIEAEASEAAEEPERTGLEAAVATHVGKVISRLLTELLGLDDADLDEESNLRELGLDSVTIFALSAKVEEALGTVFDSTLLYELDTVREVATRVARADSASLAQRFEIGAEPMKPPQPTRAEALQLPDRSRHASVGAAHDVRPTATPTASLASDIAIIGLSGRYPESDDVESFWRALIEERDLISEIPRDRWEWERYFGNPMESEESRTHSKWGGFIRDIRRFDAGFFRISPREAELMDPQQRLVLEEAWHVVEDSGYKPSALAASNTGVFIGISGDDYSNLLNQDHIKDQFYKETGSFFSIAANRVSFFMGLRGPSIAMDTACASSLVAICQAVSSLRAGECPLAIAGGVNLCITPRRFMAFSHAGMLSVDGRCKTFDRSANGYVRGEGVGLVLLKPAQQAIADGDYIYGIIKGSSVNHGGLNTTITAPNPQAQADLIVTAMNQATLDPDGISMMEAHGTGTSLGDPLEIRGLTRAFGRLYQLRGKRAPSKPHVAVGAVKTNIGHLEAASGVAGLTKILMAMKYGKIPRNLHFKELNPAIKLEGSPFYLPNQAEVWNTPLDGSGNPQPRRAGVSSFGFGGANAHVVVEAWDNARTTCLESASALIFPLSSSNGEGLRQHALRLADHLSAARDGAISPPPNVFDVARTLQAGREALDHRLAILTRSLDELIVHLRAVGEGRSLPPGVWLGEVSRKRPGAKAKPEVAAGDPATVCASWVTGGEVGWPTLARQGQRTPLPGYLFKGEAYWLPDPPVRAAAALVEPAESNAPVPTAFPRLHPLVHANTPSAEGTRFLSHFTGSEFYLHDHIVAGHPVLPGTAFLEMGRAAGALTGFEPTSLHDVHWDSPIVVDQPRPVETRLTADGENYRFEAVSGDQQVHAGGLLARGPVPRPAPDPEDPARRCPRELDPRSFYERLEKLGLSLRGGAFEVIRELRVGAREVFARLALAGPPGDLILHPALLDGALQTTYALFFEDGDDRLQVPVAIERLAIFAPLPQSCRVHTKRTRLTARGVASFDIRIAGEDGELVVAIEGFMARPFAASVGRPLDFEPELPIDERNPLLSPQWETRVPRVDPIPDDRLVLLFDTDAERWQTLWSHSGSRALWVRPGSGFRACEPGVFEVNPHDEDDYRALIRHVAGMEREPGGVIYLWGAENEHPYLAFGNDAESVFAPLFLLTRALALELPGNRVRIAVPYRANQSERAAAHAGLSGFARTLARERPAPVLTLLALPGDDEPDAENWIEAALRGLSWRPASGSVFELQRGQVRLRVLRRLDAEDRPTTPLRANGAYLLTGGRGALGAMLARHLARNYRARLMLCAKSAPDGSTRALVAELAELGGTAHYVAADLTDAAATRRLIDETMTRLGELHGIFHLAGRHIDHAIQNKDLAEVLQVLRPKVTGLRNLDLATAELDLDFVLSYSSLVPIVGVAGQTDYAFANGFLDAFSDVRNAWVGEGRRRGRTISVNWSHWRDGGMRLAAHTETWIREVAGLRPLETQEGLEILEKVIRNGWPQVTVAPADPAALAPESFPTEPVTSTSVDVDRKALEQLVGDLVRATLGIRKLDPKRPLYEYGADSINLTELTNKINKRLGLRLTPVLFFDYTTLAALLDYMMETQRPALSRALTGAGAITSPAGPAPTPVPAVAGPAPVPALPAARPVSAKPEPPAIAVVGMAGIMPGSPDLDAFWQHLVDGRDLVTEVPPERWDWSAYDGDPATGANKTCSRWGGFMHGVDQFDYGFFGLTRREAMLMDPQQRLLLALSWNAIEDAGHGAADLAGTPTGVFMGVSSFDYFDLMKNHQLDIEAHTSTGVAHSILANRISWFFDLTGPSLPVDTACSSSLVALHQAMEAFASGSCTAALVGGVNLLVSPTIHISFGKAGMLSPNGRCRTFDASADGYVRGEGAGVVYLKRLEDALADGDTIHAIIRGSAVNHGGHAKSLTAPNPKAQADLICRAQDQAGFAPETVTYIEAHGTGTSLGDPIEIHGLIKAFQRRFREAGRTPGPGPWCGIGSVKTNVGHLEAGAGMAGLFKVVQAMRAGVLPANIHQAQRNPYIELENSPFYLLDSRREWKRLRDEDGSEIPRRAGISSFGFGGANAHVVLEEHFEREPRPAASAGPWLLVLSARDAARLRERARDLAAFLVAGKAEPGGMADLAYTLQVGREPMESRAALVVNGVEDAVQALGALARGVPHGRSWEGTAAEEPPALDPGVMKGGDLDAIGRAFVKGAVVDWSALQDVSGRRRVRLPGYPFAPTRCWLPLADGLPPEGGVPRPRFEHRETDSAQPMASTPAGVRDFVLGFESLEALAVNWLVRSLLNLDVLVPNRTRYVWSEQRPPDLAPQMTRLFDALPFALAQRDRARFDGFVLTLTNPGFAQDAEQMDPHAAGLALGKSCPALQAHLRLLTTCMEQFDAVLTGRTRATDVLFPNADDGLVAGMYRNNPHADHLNRLVAERLRSRVGGESYRILEVGAGTGGATRAVLDSLAGKPNVHYTYTDVSHHFLEIGRAQFEPGSVPISFAVLDLEKDPLQQGFEAEGFDAVVSANVLHATRRVSETLGRLSRLLKPGGVLLVNELTQPLAFITLTFGLLEGWWRYDPSETRQAGSPLLSLDQWQAALAAAGFGVPLIHGQDVAGSVLAQHVIEASRSVGVVRGWEPEAELQYSARADLPGSVRLLLADSLQAALREPGPIALEKPFVDLGVDSLFGIELIGRLNKVLGLSLKPSVLFDHPSPLKLAAHLVEVYPEPLTAWLKGSAPENQATQQPAAVPARNPAADAAARPLASAPISHDEARREPMAQGGAGLCLGVVLGGREEPAQIRPQPIGVPQPGPGTVLIRVRAFSVSYGDLLCIQGLYPTMPEYPFTPGMEVAGEIAGLGAGVSGFRLGERVVALTGGHFGGHASMALADAHTTVSVPVGISFEHAVAFPVGFLLMTRALTLAEVGEGDNILIQSAGGGAGTIGVQLALQRGAVVFVTAGSEARVTALRSLGAHHVIDYHEADFAERIRFLTNGAGLDVVINNLGGAAMQKGLDLLAPGGRYVETAMMALRASKRLDLSRLVDNQSYFSVDLRRYLGSHPQRARSLMAEMAKTLAEGRIKPLVARSFAFEKVHEAYAWLQERRSVGRVVVSVPRSLHDEVRPHISEIAVIGMAGRYPKAADMDAFWTNLAEGRNCIEEVPRERWCIDDHYDPKPRTPGRTYCRFGGFLDQIDLFDASFFNISGTEAARMDPQQRLFLETAWQAMEQAGYTHIRRQRCGVFVGAGFGDYQHRFLSRDTPPTAHVFSGNQASILAARIAYHLDLRGPALAIDTACSSSLVAIHLACESIRSGESDLAIAGGVFVSVTPSFHVLSSQMGMLSPTGHCAAFDVDADGFVPGEGVGAVVLKPLEKALADGDHIWGVIRATGVNQDGATNGITAPSTQSQTELLEEVYRAGGISIEDIGYVEAHGTGTRLGDPIEVEALTRAFGTVHRPGLVALGSVKSNIGHTAMAAGIASLAKVLLAMAHQQIPPSLHFLQANPLIRFAGTPFFVNTGIIPWPEPPGGTRLAAISSFGFSGTNSHVVVAEPPRRPLPSTHEPFPTLVAFSGPRPEDADRHVRVLAQFLADAGEELRLIDVAYTLNARRTHFRNRVLFLVASLAELRTVLGAYTRESPPDGCIQGRIEEAEEFIRLDDQVAHHFERASMGGQAGHKALVALGECFARGYPLDWSRLYCDNAPRCLPLPGYPLDRRRYWVSKGGEGSAPEPAARAAPEADARTPPAPTVSVLALPEALNSELFFVRDHSVGGRPLLPGVAYLELAAARWEQLDPHRRIAGFRDLTFLRPLFLSVEPVPIQVDMTAEGRFSLRTHAGAEEHARGVLAFEPAPVPADQPRFEQAIQGMSEERGADFYQRLTRSGFDYGPGMRAVTSFHCGKKTAVARLRLPVEAGAVDDFRLHPSLLDSALQAVAGMRLGERPLLAFFIESVQLHRRCQAEMLAHVGEEAEGRFWLRLADPEGRVAVAMSGICGREARPSDVLPVSEAPDPLDGVLFRPIFERIEPVSTADPETFGARGVLVVYRPDGPLHRELASRHAGHPVYRLRIGSTNRRISGEVWEVEAGDTDALDRLVAELPHVELVYFLAGLQHEDGTLDPQALEAHETRGVLTLFHLVQALRRHRPGQRLAVKAVTDASAPTPGGGIKPFSAHLHGFCRSAAREMPHIRFACIDVGPGDPTAGAPGELERVAAAIAAEPTSGQGRLVVLRDGQRYARSLAPVQLPALGEGTPYRRGGSYLILGGAGGIGMVLARHLVQTVGARVTLVGRRPASEVAGSIAELRAKGGKALYLQADAARPGAMAAVVEQVHARFGPIHGAIHSAMVLKDRLIEHMNGFEFDAALSPKTRATVHFCQALEHEPLDFLLLFSSLQSFVGGAGQSNYASGGTFLDAYSDFWRTRVAYPVKLLHWGYWGSVGVVASETYRQRMGEMGLHSIEPELGMEALDRFLASTWDELLVVRAEARFLEQVGVQFEPVWHTLPTRAASLVPAVDPLGAGVRPGPEVERAIRVFGEFEAWCADWVPALLVRLGLDPAGRPPSAPAELADRWGLQPRFFPLLQALFHILEHTGGASPSGNGHHPGEKDFSSWDLQVARGRAMGHPSIAAFVKLVQSCVDSFHAVVSGAIPAADILFPKGSDHLVAGIYRDNPIADYYNGLARDWLATYLQQRKRAGIAAPTRILEVGAGTGGTTAALLRALDGHDVRYFFSELSPALVSQALGRFAGSRPWLQCRVFDLEKDPLRQGLHPGSFDLIVAGNAVHATSDVTLTLRRLKALLAGDGWLLLNELTADHRFATLSFGLLEAWWAFRDGWRRVAHSPLLEPRRWVEALEENGFQQVTQLGPSGPAGLRQRLLLGQSDGRIALAKGQTLALAGRWPDETETRAPSPATLKAVLRGNDLDLDVVCTRIAAIMAQVLEVPASELDWDSPHQRYGVDSILAVDIVDRINVDLGLGLRSTDFFNFATMRELATHVLAAVPAAEASPRSGGEAPIVASTAEPLALSLDHGFDEAALLDVFRRVASGESEVEEASRLIVERAREG